MYRTKMELFPQNDKKKEQSVEFLNQSPLKPSGKLASGNQHGCSSLLRLLVHVLAL